MVKLKKQKVSNRKKNILFSGKSGIRVQSAIKFVLVMLMLVGIGIGMVRLKYMFVDSEYFIVKGVDIELYDNSGSRRNIPVNEIGEMGLIGANIFFVNLNAIKARIENAHPEFKNVVVRRLLPDKLVLKADLRKAAAQVRSDRYYVVDAEGIFLPEPKNFPDEGLPVIAGIGMKLSMVSGPKLRGIEREKLDKALSFIRDISDNRSLAKHKLKMVDTSDQGNLSFFLDEANVEIKIGSSDFKNRLGTLVTVLEQLGTDFSKFKYIDLRFDDPIIGPR